MDDLSEKLAELLNDPESMNRVRQMAENLLGNAGGGADAQPATREETAVGILKLIASKEDITTTSDTAKVSGWSVLPNGTYWFGGATLG